VFSSSFALYIFRNARFFFLLEWLMLICAKHRSAPAFSSFSLLVSEAPGPEAPPPPTPPSSSSSSSFGLFYFQEGNPEWGPLHARAAGVVPFPALLFTRLRSYGIPSTNVHVHVLCRAPLSSSSFARRTGAYNVVLAYFFSHPLLPGGKYTACAAVAVAARICLFVCLLACLLRHAAETGDYLNSQGKILESLHRGRL
jgi:hypothetical protein